MDKWSDPVGLELSKPISRSLRLEGYATSVRLEAVFWDVLDRIASEEGVSTVHLVGDIYQRNFAGSDEHKNFASLLRVISIRHLNGRQRDFATAADQPAEGIYSGGD